MQKSLIGRRSPSLLRAIEMIVMQTRRICLLFFMALITVAHAEDNFRFTIYDPCNWGRACATQVLVSGVIPFDAVEKFDREINNARKNKKIDPNNAPIVVFDSPGGSLIGAIKLGNYLRKNRYSTGLSPKYIKSELRRVNNSVETVDEVLSKDAVCASACVFAFIGGSSRFVDEGARIGIHQASSPEKVELQAGQSLTAFLQDYSLRMTGVQRLADEVIRISADEIKWLTPKEIIDFQIYPNEIQTPWELKKIGNIFALHTLKYVPQDRERYLELFMHYASNKYYATIVDKNGKHIGTRNIHEMNLEEIVDQLNGSASFYQKNTVGKYINELYSLNGDSVIATRVYTLSELVEMEKNRKTISVSEGCGGGSVICLNWNFDTRGLTERLGDLR